MLICSFVGIITSDFCLVIRKDCVTPKHSGRSGFKQRNYLNVLSDSFCHFRQGGGVLILRKCVLGEKENYCGNESILCFKWVLLGSG